MTISNFAYEKKRQKVRKILDKQGWKINDYNTHDKSHNVYFYHVATGKQFLVAVTPDKQIRDLANKHKYDLGEIVNYLCVQNNLTEAQEKELQKGVSLWAIATQTFELTESSRTFEDFSTLIIFYPGINKDVFIRPICFPVEQGRLITPDKVIEFANYAFSIDQKNHPERFHKKAEVVNIKESSREN